MHSRKNLLKTIYFEKPDFIPVNFHINDASFNHYPQDWLFEQMENHPLLFPNFKMPEKLPLIPEYSTVAKKDEPYTDDFGCIWQTSENGITGTVTKHPLPNWDNWDSYNFPNPENCMGIGPVNWQEVRKQIAKAKKQGFFTSGGLRHGHTFLQLCDMRGYENLIFDMADEEDKLWQLIEKLEAFNSYIIDQYVDMDVDMISYAEDLGMQKGPMLSPDNFRKYIKPSYKRLMDKARGKGIAVHMHSDGDIRLLADDLIDGGVQIINLQDLVNGIDWIAAEFAGKTCVDLDIDRQDITVFGTPAQVKALIKEEVEKINRKEGGLMFTFGLYPGTPLENVVALMDSLEYYAVFI